LKAIWAVPFIVSIVVLGTFSVSQAFATHDIPDFAEFISNPGDPNNAFGDKIIRTDSRVLVVPAFQQSLISDPCAGTNVAGNGGTIYIFDDISGELLKTIPNPDKLLGVPFGSVPGTDAEGDKIIAGMPVNANCDRSQDAGIALLLDIHGNVLETFLPPPNSECHIAFGQTVAISGDKVLIGREQYRGVLNCTPTDGGPIVTADDRFVGEVFLYDLNGNLLHRFINPEDGIIDSIGVSLGNNDRFGRNILMEGDTILINSITNVPIPSGFEGLISNLQAVRYIYDTSGNLLNTILQGTNIDDDIYYTLNFNTIKIDDGRILVAGDLRAKDLFQTSTGTFVSIIRPGIFLFDTSGNLVNFLRHYNCQVEFFSGVGNILSCGGEIFDFSIDGNDLLALDSTRSSSSGDQVSHYDLSLLNPPDFTSIFNSPVVHPGLYHVGSGVDDLVNFNNFLLFSQREKIYQSSIVDDIICNSQLGTQLINNQCVPIDTIPQVECGPGTTQIGDLCDPDVTQADLDSVEAQRDAILATLFEFLRIFGVI